MEQEEKKLLRLYRKGRSGAPLEGYRALRAEYGLSVIEAAAALGTTPSTVELWEARTDIGPGQEHVRSRYEQYRRENVNGSDSNMLFTVYPLRVARDMLRKEQEDIASLFGYSAATWQKFESNQRVLDRKILRELESMVRANFAATCKASDDRR